MKNVKTETEIEYSNKKPIGLYVITFSSVFILFVVIAMEYIHNH